MILLILETLPVVVVSMLLGAWVVEVIRYFRR